jgi:DsbC/DsbD-like thiol-disulfide interchange protein
MSYLTIAAIAEDTSMRRRIAACAAVEGVQDAETWAYRNSLNVAAQPGWAAAWESAGAAGNLDPGSDPAVITDGMILSAVQALSGGAL